MSIELVPKWKFECSTVGKGRDDPNVNPYLPPPVGRFHFSWNPFEMFAQLVGPGIRRKIYCACCLILCVLFLVFAFPNLSVDFIAVVLNPFNYNKRRLEMRNDLPKLSAT